MLMPDKDVNQNSDSVNTSKGVSGLRDLKCLWKWYCDIIWLKLVVCD
jgi:hypothetical protein